MEFIPLAEETGLIVPLGRWILEEACMQARKWQTKYQYGEELSITVNVASRQFEDESLSGIIEHALAISELPPRSLILEITESTMLANTEATIKKLTELKTLGIRFAIDDFGTGYSSLSYLKRFPIDTLKIDRTFVSDVSTNEDDAAIAKAIVMMGHALDMSVIAEGVETPQQLEYLTSLGCDAIQGYLFSPPLSTQSFTELLMEQLRAITPSVERGTTRLQPLVSE